MVMSVHGRNGNKYQIASFHGDTNGLASIRVVEKVLENSPEDHLVIMGLDANSHTKGIAGKKLGVDEFQNFLSRQRLISGWGPR